jgi:predicted acetyltransferase
VTSNLRYEPVPIAGDLHAEARILSTAFGTTPDHSAQWIENSGRQLFRRLVDGDRVLGTIVLVPMGIYFGGKSIPMTGIAGVAVDPTARGRGVARQLMEHALREIHDQGVPLSGLYSAMHPLYRSVGYEHAGAQYRVKVPLHLLPRSPRQFERFTDADFDEVKACYAQAAHTWDGHLDRGPYCWGRVKNFRGHLMQGFVSRDDQGVLDAYVFCNQNQTGDIYDDQQLTVMDFAATTPAALKGVMGFLRGYSSISGNAVWKGSPSHPILTALDDRRYTVELLDHWMLRVVNLPEALKGRGVRGGGQEAVDIAVVDDLFPKNAGNWTVSVEAGRYDARRGGSGSVSVTARGLAALYTGFMSARQLALINLVEGDTQGLDQLDAVFPVGQPTMIDIF